mmetsp:Transcript_37665/g.108725  ORF Transcript_37665/g.108725 Transcript_37665/m.108725 type:complete len:215 (+) Transcript_37665:302-946(+)
MASAERTPRLLPSHSSFCRLPFFSSMPPKDMPSSSQRPFRFKSMDMHEVLLSRAWVRRRSLTDPSSMPHMVMCCWLTLRCNVSRIWSNPPSIFFRCSSSSRRFRSASALFSLSCCCRAFCACCSCRRAASCCAFFFRSASAAAFFNLNCSIFCFCSCSVRLVFGRTSTGGLKTRLPRTSFSSSSYADKSSPAAVAAMAQTAMWRTAARNRAEVA